MSNAFFEVPIATNEPVLNYAPGSPERAEVQAVYAEMKAKQIDIPMYIGGKKVKTKTKIKLIERPTILGIP